MSTVWRLQRLGELAAAQTSTGLLLQFFQSRSVQVNYGTTVRNTTLLVIWAAALMFCVYWKFWSFKVQCPEFPQDAPECILCLNLRMEVEVWGFMLVCESPEFCPFLPAPFFPHALPFRHHRRAMTWEEQDKRTLVYSFRLIYTLTLRS